MADDLLRHTDILIVTLLVCFLIVMILWRLLRPHWRDTLSNFLFPTPSLTDNVKAKRKEGRRMLIAILFCMESAVLTSAVAGTAGFFNYIMQPVLLLSIYALVFLIYITLKQFLYHFVHGIFFSREQNTLWRNSFAFLFFIETALMFPLLLIIVFRPINAFWPLYIGAMALLFVKIVLLFKCFSTFFRKKYGLMHLFMYFCTLEGAPAVVLGASLIEITRNLTLI